MRWVVRVAVALLASASGHVCVADTRGSAAAPDLSTILYFSGTDLWRHGSFTYGGLLWSPGGLDREGFTLKLLLGGGNYRYTSGALGDAEVTGRQLAAFVLPGWRFTRDKMMVTVFAGLDVQDHRHTPFDPGSDLRGTQAGIRGGFEFWYEPDAASMWAADFSVSSIGPGYSARVATGWRVLDSFYVGPEVGGFAAGDDYNQVRAGLHITGFKTQGVEWSAAFGWATDSDDRDSFYGRLGILTRR